MYTVYFVWMLRNKSEAIIHMECILSCLLSYFKNLLFDLQILRLMGIYLVRTNKAVDNFRLTLDIRVWKEKH